MKRVTHIGVALMAASCLAWGAGCGSGNPRADRVSSLGSTGALGSGLPKSTVNDAMVRCMSGLGWPGQMQLTGDIDFGTVPDAQQSQFSKDEDTCVKQTGWGDLGALTASQRANMYTREVTEYKCLRKLGLTPPEPPSEQTYVDTFHSAQQYYAGATMQLTQEEIRACPPPTWYLN